VNEHSAGPEGLKKSCELITQATLGRWKAMLVLTRISVFLPIQRFTHTTLSLALTFDTGYYFDS